ncbi:MAG: hypothetical protein PUP92_21270 [Rhizonema sp. PD38]|nr:hypothetical protein [Rhizonema sp. NSF051]MDF5730481.1 hypothetical protein [Rhizonema sp. PD38]
MHMIHEMIYYTGLGTITTLASGGITAIALLASPVVIPGVIGVGMFGVGVYQLLRGKK